MESTWQNEVKLETFPTLSGDIQTDVIIVGGGLSGMLSAYFINKEGKKVVVIEKSTANNSVTAHTTAFLSYIIDTRLYQLIKMFGSEKAVGVWESGRDAIDLLEGIINFEKIDCEFMRCSEFVFANDKKEWGSLRREGELGKAIGFDAVINGAENLSFKNFGSVEYLNQGKFHPLKFLEAIRKIVSNSGVLIYENTEVLSVEKEGLVVKVKTKKGSVIGTHAIITTYDPFNKPKELRFHKGTYISYLIELMVPSDLTKEGIYLDNDNPYQYFRVDAKGNHSRMILGGQDHRHEFAIDPEKAYKALENYFKDKFPNVPYYISRKWKGPILESIDGLPFIGRLQDGDDSVLVATAFSGNGMTYSVIAALIFRDIVRGMKSPWEHIYRPTRKLNFESLWQKTKDYLGKFWGGTIKLLFGLKK